MRFMLAAIVLVSLATLVASDVKTAGVFRCQSGARVVYQDKPCTAGETVRDFEADPPAVSVIPFAIPPPSPPPARTERAPRASPRSRGGSRNTAIPRSDAQIVERRHLREGMSDGEVLARLGAPDLKSGGGRGVANWTYLPAPGDEQTVTVVRLEKGRVLAVDRKLVR